MQKEWHKVVFIFFFLAEMFLQLGLLPLLGGSHSIKTGRLVTTFVHLRYDTQTNTDLYNIDVHPNVVACNGTRPMYEPLCDYLPRMHIVSIRRWRNAFYFLPLLILDVFSPLFNELPFQKKWYPAFAIILKKIVCNLAKFCHALYEITCTYWLGVVIDQTFSSAKLFGWTSMVQFFYNPFNAQY